jgi:PAS domain S-box-containing protein
VEAVLLATADGRVLAANESASRVFGYTASELLQLTRAELTDATDERFARAVAARRKDGGVHGVHRCLRKGGVPFECEITSSAFPGPAGELWVWILIRDITETQVAERALRETQEQLGALSDAAFEAVVAHDRGTILFANAAAERLYRCPPGGMVGRSLDEFCAPESLALIRQNAAAGVAGPYEAFARRLDGTVFQGDVQGRSVTYQGRAIRVVVIRDLTDRKRSEAALARADRLATMGRLAAAVAHEINNPLTFVTANLGLAIERLLAGPESRDAVQRTELLALIGDAQRGAARVREIVSDLGAFSRDGDGAPEPVDLERVVRDACGVAQHEIKHRAQLELRLAPVPPVRGTEARLGQVVLNLLVNAAQAIAEGDVSGNRITVATSLAGDGRVALDVTDTGSGIAPEVRAGCSSPSSRRSPSASGPASDSRSPTESSRASAARSTSRARSAAAPRSTCASRWPIRGPPPPRRPRRGTGSPRGAAGSS